MKTYRSPDETSITSTNNDTKRNSSLLLRLSTCTSDPTQDDTVNGISADSKDDHGEVASDSIERCEAENETDYGNGFGDGNVPCTFIVFTTAP